MSQTIYLLQQQPYPPILAYVELTSQMKELVFWWWNKMVFGVQLACLIFQYFKLHSTSFDIVYVAWHTLDLVCDDSFTILEAHSACYTLGYTNGGTAQISYDMSDTWSETEIPILMDNVACGSASTNFTSCSSEVADDSDSHTENILLTCIESGKAFTVRGLIFSEVFCPDFLMRLTKIVS